MQVCTYLNLHSVACLNYRLKLKGALKTRINDLPRFLLPSSQSAPASQLPHLTSCLPSELPAFPDHSVTIYLFILIFRAKGWWGFLPALNYTHFPLLRWRNQSTFSRLGDGIWTDSCLPRAVVRGAGWAPVGQEQLLLQIGDRRLKEHFQGVTGIALLSGWPWW